MRGAADSALMGSLGAFAADNPGEKNIAPNPAASDP